MRAYDTDKMVACIAGKKKPYTALLQCRTFLCRKNGVHRGKISVVDMVFLVSIGLLCPPPAWKAFFETRKVLQKIFGGGCVRCCLRSVKTANSQA